MNDAYDQPYPGQAPQNAQPLPGFDPFQGIYAQLHQFNERLQQVDEQMRQLRDLVQNRSEEDQDVLDRLQKIEERIKKPLDNKQRRRITAINEYDRFMADGTLTREHLRVLRRACKPWAGKGVAYNETETFLVSDEERKLWSDLVKMEFARRVPSPNGASAAYCTITDLGRTVCRHDVTQRGK